MTSTEQALTDALQHTFARDCLDSTAPGDLQYWLATAGYLLEKREDVERLRDGLREALTMPHPGSNPTPQEWNEFVTTRERLFALLDQGAEPTGEQR